MFARLLITILSTCLMPAILLAGEPARAYLYPDVLQSEKNLLHRPLSQWQGRSLPECQMLRGRGGPFSADAEVLIIDSAGTRPNYWGSGARVQPGRTYLAGAWVKNDNAKILLWFHGTYGKPGQPPRRLNDRIYFFAGASRYLERYLSEEVTARLGGDPDAWRLCYRLITIPENTDSFHLNVNVGTYFATGRIHIADPFLIDVTDTENFQMKVDVAGNRPIRSLAVIASDLRDIVWRQQFNPPVTTFQKPVPETHFKRGLDRRLFESYQLHVEYEDGGIDVFHAPQAKTSRSL